MPEAVAPSRELSLRQACPDRMSPAEVRRNIAGGTTRPLSSQVLRALPIDDAPDILDGETMNSVRANRIGSGPDARASGMPGQ